MPPQPAQHMPPRRKRPPGAPTPGPDHAARAGGALFAHTPLACTTCGNPDWIAALPGHAPAPPDPGEVVVPLHPDPETPTVAWCAVCWPWWRPTP